MLYQIPAFYDQFLHFRCVVQSSSEYHAHACVFCAILNCLTEIARLPSCINYRNHLLFCREVAIDDCASE